MIYNKSSKSFIFGKLNSDKSSFEVSSGNLNNLKELAGKCEIIVVENLKYLFICELQSGNKSAFLLDPLAKSETKISSLGFENKEMIRNLIFDNKNEKAPIAFVVRKTQAINEYSVEVLKFISESTSFESLGIKSFALADGDEIKIIRGNYSNESKERYSYVFVTKLHQIRTVHIHDNVN